jgi:molecular chaperone DnaJ
VEPARDYYEVLGVDRNADQRTIKRAFLKLARTLHPDVNKEPDAEERFKEVNEAYSVLSDEQKRANYDAYGDPNGPGGFGSEYVDMSDIFGEGFGMSDIFESFFGGGGGRGARAARTRGRDMGVTLRITLEEATAGCTKTIAYDRLSTCDDCGGTGVAEGGHPKTCDRCHGSGRVVEFQRTIFGQMQSQTTCPVCGGTGQVVDKPCETCQGQGRTPDHETVKVEIPAGVMSGQSIRVAGRGEAGVRGDVTGDLVVTIQVLDDERFERQGDTLYHLVIVDSIDAMLGTDVEIDGILEGERVKVHLPAGIQYGDRITAGSYGMPHLGSTYRGDMVFVVQTQTPDDLTADQIDLLRQIQEGRKANQAAATAAGKAAEPPADEPKKDEGTGKKSRFRPRKSRKTNTRGKKQ